VLTPVFEEIIFRGLLFATLRRRFGTGTAAVLSASIFAIAHGYGVLGFAAVFWSGLLWAFAYERTGSLLPSMAAHAADNLMASIGVLLIRRGESGSRGIRAKGRPAGDTRAVRRAQRGRRQPLRRAQALGAAASLRPASADRRRAEELGRAQGALRARPREAPRGARRRPPARGRQLPGDHPRGQLRRGAVDRMGRRPLRAREARARAPADRARQAGVRAIRLQAARAVDARSHERQGKGLASPQEGRRVRGRGGAYGALPGVGSVGPDR